MVDVDGNQLIDMGAGIGVTTIGHTDDSVVAAATEQLEKLTHTLFTVTPYEGYVRVAELLAQHTPGDFEKKTVLVNAGAEAVENGVKIARKHTGRYGVAVLEHAYHGRTNLTMAMNFKAAPYSTGFGPFAGDIYRAPNSYPYHDGLQRCGCRQAHDRLPREDGRRERPRLPRGRTDPGRGRIRGAGRRLPAGTAGVVHRERDRVHRRRDPERDGPHR